MGVVATVDPAPSPIGIDRARPGGTVSRSPREVLIITCAGVVLASLDLFIMTLRDLAFAAKAGDRERFLSAPHHAPRRRLDETRAARQPVLRWTRPSPVPAT